jgi:hypothetical protein
VKGPGLILAGCLWAHSGMAGDRLDLTGQLDMRWVGATGETSYLNGGLGALRFDPDHEGLRLGRAFLASRLRLTDIVTLHMVLDSYGDHDRNPIGLSECWAEIRPFPTSALRWHARIGAFYMPISLENRGPGWSDVYTITPSALNSWIGEEFRTIGAEVEARWLGASSEYLGDFALVAAVYGWNDAAGSLLADGGFSLTDRPSLLFGDLGRPPMSFYHEIDHRPGYYSGLIWRHHDRLEIRALRYDNRADPSAASTAGAAWRTRFSSLGARWEPTEHWTVLAQYLSGDTESDAYWGEYLPIRMTYRTAFALASFEAGRERLSARFDHFETHQSSVVEDQPANESGHAGTLAWTHEFGEHWQAVAEWIHVWSRFPPRAEYGQPVELPQTETQIAVRYRFHGTFF